MVAHTRKNMEKGNFDFKKINKEKRLKREFKEMK